MTYLVEAACCGVEGPRVVQPRVSQIPRGRSRLSRREVSIKSAAFGLLGMARFLSKNDVRGMEILLDNCELAQGRASLYS
jgi:hypothetical protein